ncbi:MAG: type II toxin-antitoxin system RelE/ParE family toxin, partial [Chitinophagaceae bacterium]|nr:type II toxin-antitoxin system RelE/ParE family toxin [Chitinophagaceae bacterium]
VETLSGKPKYGAEVVTKFKKTVLMLKNTESVAEIRKFKGLNFEALKEDLKGFYSVRVDKQYRLILSVHRDTLIISEILIILDLTNHYQ